MLSTKLLVLPLRVLLIVIFCGLVLGQFLSFPGMFAHWAQEDPDFGFLRWPLTTFAFLELLCVQVVIVCIWRLLTMVKHDRIFSSAAFGWVDAIVWAMAAGWVLLAGMAAYLCALIYFTPEIRDPGVPIMLTGFVLIGAVVVLLMVVMRALLRQAAILRADLEVVI